MMQSNNHRQPRPLSEIRRLKAIQRRNEARRRSLLSIMFVVFTGIFTFSFITFFESGFHAETTELTPPSALTPSTDQPEDTSAPVGDSEIIEQFVIPEVVDRTINLTPAQAQSAKMLSLPENGKVDMSYFNDAVFMGDSLSQGFVEAYQIFPNSYSAAYKSMSTSGFVSQTVAGPDGVQINPIDLMATYSPAKIYILIGVNDLVWMSEDQLAASFTMLFDTLNAKMPNAIKYVMSIPPQTEARSADPRYSVSYINGFNDKLAVIANERNVHYLDLHEIVADSSGYLRAEIAQPDGFHITPSGYIEIRDYLISHTVHTDTNPYLPGSPHYIDPATATTTDPVAAADSATTTESTPTSENTVAAESEPEPAA